MQLRLFISIFLLFTLPSFKNLKAQPIYKSWILSQVTYKDHSPLPDDNVLKYSYNKYTFSKPDKLNISGEYADLGSAFLFELYNGQLLLKSNAGSVMNTIGVEKLDNDTLTLIYAGLGGQDDPKSLRYQFVAENIYQNSLTVNKSNIYSLGGDTVYKQSPKVYAVFKGETLQSTLKVGQDKDYMHNKSGNLQASFIVFKTGRVDSLKIIKSIDATYDKMFIKEFNKQKKNWIPATLGGAPVNVEMFYEVRYLTSDMAMPSYQFATDADRYYKEKDYKSALELYNQALNAYPFDNGNLYKRAICNKMLGNLDAACLDWKRIKELGGTNSVVLIEKYCR